MKMYYVDLSGFSAAEHDRVYGILHDFSHDFYVVAGRPGVYLVRWDYTESIESVTGIPSSLITLS